MASIHLVRAFGCGHLLHPYFPAVWSSGQNSWFNCLKLWAGSEGQIVGCSGKNGKLKVSGAKVLCIWSSSVLHSVVAFWYFAHHLISSCDSCWFSDRSRPLQCFLGIYWLLHDCKDLRLTFQKRRVTLRGQGACRGEQASPLRRFAPLASNDPKVLGFIGVVSVWLTEIFRVLRCPPGVKAVKDAWMVLLH